MEIKNVMLRKLFYMLLVMLVAGVFIIMLMPKLIAFFFLQMGYPLNSGDHTTKYLMGIGVRAVGFVIFLCLMKKQDMLKRYQFKLNGRDVLLSWMILIYIAFNIQIVSLKDVAVMDVILMVLDCIMVGLYEETIFRGYVLSLLLEGEEESKKQIVPAVVISSVTFGLMHLSNIANASLIPVLYQVVYASVIGVAFSAILIRTNWNLGWCVILHALYDIADGFSDFLPKVENSIAHNIEIMPYVLNLLTFLPLLLYALFLLRNAGNKPESKIV